VPEKKNFGDRSKPHSSSAGRFPPEYSHSKKPDHQEEWLRNSLWVLWLWEKFQRVGQTLGRCLPGTSHQIGARSGEDG
jgi:hypothetical protein